MIQNVGSSWPPLIATRSLLQQSKDSPTYAFTHSLTDSLLFLTPSVPGTGLWLGGNDAEGTLLLNLEKGQKKSPESITDEASMIRRGGAGWGVAFQAG